MRTYVVTGSASGIGAACAARLGRDGHRVIGVDRGGADVEVDLATPGGRADMVSRLADLADTIDGVIACAGVGMANPEVVEINFFGVVATLTGLRPVLAASGGRAVAISSAAVLMPLDPALVDACLALDEAVAVALGRAKRRTAYASTKAALSRWIRARSVTEEWAGCGVALNAVAPGLVDTPLTAAKLRDPDIRPLMEQEMPMPMGRVLTADEVASVAVWLASPEASLVTGQTVFVDGGYEALRHADC